MSTIVVATCLLGTIICSLLAIRWPRQATANWERAEENWRSAEKDW